MTRQNPFHSISWLAAFFAVFLSSAMAKSPDAGKSKNRIRIVCVSAVNEEQEVILAVRDAGEKWRELGTAKLRSSLVTDWLPAAEGELHLTVREGETLKSIGHFTCPADSSRSLVVLIADPQTKAYNTHWVDPAKSKFVKGTFLVFNFSPQTASVFLGPNEEKIEAGQQALVKPTLEENGMFRMQVTRPGENGKTEACYDRYISGRQDSREMLFLLPDEKIGIKVMSMSLFSDLD